MRPADMTCNGGYTSVALANGHVQTVGTGSVVITLSRTEGSIYANIPFLVIVMKDGRSEYSKRIHWLADARAEFTRQIRYHLGSKMNEMTRDKRFTFEREWTGKPYPVWVGRLAGEFYSYGITKAEAMMIAWEKVNSSSNTERK